MATAARHGSSFCTRGRYAVIVGLDPTICLLNAGEKDSGGGVRRFERER